MAISRVQYTGNYADDTTAVTCATTSNVTSGNLLVIYAMKYSPSSDPFVIGDISKSAGSCTLGSFTLDVDHEGGTYASSAVYSAPITGSGSCTIQVTGVSGSWFLLALEELSGADTGASRLEDTSEGTGNSSAASSGDATSAAGAIFCGCMADLQAGATTHTEDAAFTLIYEQSTADHMTGSAASRIVSSGTTDAATWAMGVSASWVAVVAVHKASSGGTNVQVDCRPGIGILRASGAALNAVTASIAGQMRGLFGFGAIASVVATGGVTLTQEGFRWRNDNGDEDEATWAADQDANHTVDTLTPVRLRVLVDSSGDTDAAAYQLEYRKVGDPSWSVVE